MFIIYFDNVRGFEKTFLDLRNVNFFVGENSTGKTSVLKLIGIVSSQAFWRYGEFGTPDINLGTFNDIITRPSNGKEYFDIGIADDNSDSKDYPFFIRLRFIERDKRPLLKEMVYSARNVNIQASLEGNFLKYRYKLSKKRQIFSILEFQNWIDSLTSFNGPFKKIETYYAGIVPTINLLFSEILTHSSSSVSKKSLKDFKFRLPQIVNKFAWIAPVRAKPLHQYRDEGLVYNSEGSHTPGVLRNILTKDVKKILNRFGEDSGLFNDIETKDLIEAGLLKETRPIKTSLDKFEIVVKINQKERNIANVGYGISQVLPIVVEAIARADNTWFAAQQPEVHLHPRAQAALGDFIFKTQINDSQKFILETHSDYLIDRFRLRLNRAFNEQNPCIGMAQLVFFSKTKSGNSIDILEFNSDGSYPINQPNEFRDFFIKEQLQLISI